MLSALVDHPSPAEAGHDVWIVNEPWLVTVRDQAPGVAALVAELSDWAALLDRHSSVAVEAVGDGTQVRWENVHGVAPEQRECAFRLGAISGLLHLETAGSADVRHPSCRARGDAECVFSLDRVTPVADSAHARLLYETSLLSAGLQRREEFFVAIERYSARSDPFPDVSDIRALRRFMEELEDPVFIFNAGLEVVDVNAAALRMTDLSRHEASALSGRELMSDRSFRMLQQLLPTLLEVGALRGLVIEGRTRAGWIPLEISARVSDTRNTLVVIARDVSEYRRLESELAERNRELREQNERIAEADRLKSEFLANVSHELTTPLTSIRGFTKLLGTDFAHESRGGEPRLPLDRRVEFTSIIAQEAERMSELIRGLLELSKIESGVLSLDRTRVSINAILRECLLVLKPRLEERSLEADARLDESIEPELMDPDRMKQVVLNLLDNAIKFSPEGSTIVIRTARMPSALRLSVRNPSRDLNREDLERIFGRFVQRDGSFTRAHGGAGLGLNLVLGLIELHRGRAWAELPEPGHVEFVIELPV